MVNMSMLIPSIRKALVANAPAILTGAGVFGTISTAYLASVASFRAADIIRRYEEDYEWPENTREKMWEQAKLVGSLYAPTAVAGVLTVGCVIGSAKIANRRTASAVFAYSLAERTFSEYREKVIEQYGKTKEENIRAEVAKDHVKRTTPLPEGTVLLGTGHVLCCELHTGRYFKADMETLRRAQNEVNAQAMHHLYATLDDFYDLVGLAPTTSSGNLGWDSDKLMELRFSPVLTQDNQPCLAFEYNYVKPLH
jgi:Family of unknown function (DUF6353)